MFATLLALAAAAAPLDAAADTAPSHPPPPPAGGPEFRVSKGQREVYVEPRKGAPLRGLIAAREPFEVLARVPGVGCAGDGWATTPASGFVCLEGTTVTTDAPVALPRLAQFDPPLPDEYYSYVETGDYEDDPPGTAESILPYIYGKAWRRWKGNLYASAEAYARGAAPVGQLETGLIRKNHFVREVETSRGRVLVREDGQVSPIDDVFVYPVSRHQGRDLEANPLPPDRWPAWTVDYEGAEVHTAPDPASPIAVLIPHHTPIEILSTPADSTGHWWAIPDFFGPGRPGYVDDVEGIRHPTRLPRPAVVGSDELWVDVDIAQQIFQLYRGDTLIFVTLVATGEVGWGTPKGLYRIQKKAITSDMSSRPDAAEPYYVEDVPWTMYFWPRYALHGVFWHWGFGRIASHGCVNLAPKDARHLFATLGPQLPLGWTTLWSTEADPGTTVRIRFGDAEGPDRRSVRL